jgi:hypothetical protein
MNRPTEPVALPDSLHMCIFYIGSSIFSREALLQSIAFRDINRILHSYEAVMLSGASLCTSTEKGYTLQIYREEIK